ncbi:pentapeptide repeat-containing protein [Chamaesiphon sp. VAR_69_metabat_338]|uniref:pentapeptide repeat-containing protein n=1 Tax=Chamaesiphon sp. VAR_69_metabat_338 TaxID=2964704 RepID=UPI00286E8442|nr:pentapeptide repeat-containing protein [Chamaesiphon sp. VAR_69_metabat_338]
MSRSRWGSNRTSLSSAEDTQTALASKKSWRLPWPLVIGIPLTLGGIWFVQQVSLRHFNQRVHQFQQDIDKLPGRTLPPAARLGFQKEQIMLERDRINAQNGVYNLLFQGIEVLILGGLAYTAWNYLRRTDGQFQQSQQRLITDRFSQAIAHLASDKLEIRLGGIYTLERLAQESEEDYWLTIEVLTAFVRERSATRETTVNPPLGGNPPANNPDRSLTIVGGSEVAASRKQPSPSKVPTDIQAVMTILARRDTSKDRPERIIGLRESNLRDADLNGIDLRGADLWKVNFREAQLWQAKLAGASLGRANLREASLWQANLEGAYLWKANLEGANLTEVNLEQANLDGANLKGANLQQTNLINADLRNTVGLTRQQLSDAIYNATTQLPDF